MATLWNRRQLLSSWASGAMLLAPASTMLVSGRARSQDLSSQQREDWLYDHRVMLDDKGQGMVRIGVASGISRVRLSSTTPIELGVSPHGGSRIRGGSSWEFSVHSSTPAKLSYALELASAPTRRRSELETHAKRLARMKLEGRWQERGSLLGLSGRVLDTRILRLLHGDYDSLAQASRAANKMARQLGHTPPCLAQLDTRPSGWINAKGEKLTLRAQSAVWIFAGKAPVHVQVLDKRSGQWLSRGRHFRGDLYIAFDRHGQLCVVNQIGENDALYGVVPAEIPANAPHQALCAQAIAARGQLFSKIGHRHQADPYSLCASVHCQAYSGYAVEHPRSSAAVRATRGQLLMRPDGQSLVDTVYSANSGGFSEDNDQVWPGRPDPQLRGLPDAKLPAGFSRGIVAQNLGQWLSQRPSAHCKPSKTSADDSYRWHRNLDLRKVVAAKSWPLPKGRIESLEVTDRGVSGRATRLALRIDGKSHELVGELKIRRALGGLRSSMFLAEMDGHRLALRGGGFGHGVGLCQHGAMGMARAGEPHEAILRHYYRKAKLTALW